MANKSKVNTPSPEVAELFAQLVKPATGIASKKPITGEKQKEPIYSLISDLLNKEKIGGDGFIIPLKLAEHRKKKSTNTLKAFKTNIDSSVLKLRPEKKKDFMVSVADTKEPALIIKKIAVK